MTIRSVVTAGVFGLALAASALASCQAFGPSTQDIAEARYLPAAEGQAPVTIEVVTVSSDVADRLPAPRPFPAFAEVFGDVRPVGTTVDVGDSV